MTFKPGSLTTQQLLNYYSQILDELRIREIIRTANSPIGDYAEWLVAHRLGLTLVPNSTSGHDAIDASGIKYQIKGRRITQRNKSRQLGAIRNLESHDFDFLIAVLFNEQVEVEKVIKIPHNIISKYARFSEHINAHILVLRENVLHDSLTEDITKQFRK
jgi:hypothetical protein